MASTTQRVDRRLLRESSAARPHLLVAGALGVLMAGCALAQAALLAWIITRAALHGATLSQLTPELIWLLAVFALRALLAGSFDLSGRLAATRVLTELRMQVTTKLLVDSPGRTATDRTGELAAAAVQGVDSLEAYFAGYLPALMLSATVPAAVLIWVTPIDWIASIIFIVTVPLLILFMILIGFGAQSRARRRWQALTLLSSHFLDVVRGLETLRAHRREGAQAQVITDVGEQYRKETMGTLRIAFLSALVLELCAMLGTGLVAATIGLQLSTGHLHLFQGLTVLLLAPELYAPLRSVGQQFHAAADGTAAAGRLYEVIDADTGADARVSVGTAAPVPDPRLQPLTFDHVSLRYPGRDTDALSDLQLTLEPGTTTAVLGPSGAGKSTLAALALGLMAPSSGTVSCGEVPLSHVPREEWFGRIAWVPQKTQIFTGTLAENVALNDPHAEPRRIQAAAEQAGLTGVIDSLPQRLETAVGDGGRRLSAGQAQRVALARAFLADPSLVVLDEPTANLDSETADGLVAAIATLTQGRSTLLITHDQTVADRLADRIVRLA